MYRNSEVTQQWKNWGLKEIWTYALFPQLPGYTVMQPQIVCVSTTRAREGASDSLVEWQ